METLHARTVEVGDIFALHGESYRREHKLPLQQHRAMFAIENCRTSVLGGHVDACYCCGHNEFLTTHVAIVIVLNARD